MSIYWIDSGVLISAHRGLYSPELVPLFWSPFLETHLKSGAIRIPTMCFKEVTKGNDWLAQWCKNRRTVGHFCVKSSSKEVQSCMSVVAQYVYDKHPYHSAADFLKGADAWVIAHAMATNGFVVTEELRNGYKSKIKIPVVSKALRVPWKATHEMCKELGGWGKT